MESRTLATDAVDIAYLEHGPAGGRPVVLWHGFPDDATAWTAVMTDLGARGFRCIAPYLRGFGPTRFRDPTTPRAGDFAALGDDALALLDGLDLRDVIAVGQDWGSPTSELAAALRPERVSRLLKLNWYGVYTMAELATAQGFAYAQLSALWYVWLLNIGLGEMVLSHDRRGFARALWAEWSPTWDAAARDAALDAVTPSFDNRDFARVVLSAYRSGISPSERDPRHDALRATLGAPPPVPCPTAIVHGADDGVERSRLGRESLARWFPAGARVEALSGVGHFPQREAPAAVAGAIAAAAR